jgi:hypothetical protein
MAWLYYSCIAAAAAGPVVCSRCKPGGADMETQRVKPEAQGKMFQVYPTQRYKHTYDAGM